MKITLTCNGENDVHSINILRTCFYIVHYNDQNINVKKVILIFYLMVRDGAM
jgi:hypothetical protein